MEPDELATWTEAAEALRTIWGHKRQGTLDACTDCTVAFSAEMMAQGRCNGIPGVSRKADRMEPTHDRIKGRIHHFRRVLVSMGLDPEHAYRVV